jgi:nucleoside-diphosphate-sugar epimerase
MAAWAGAMKLKCAVTGAGGYVGSRIATYMRSHGWNVLELTRSRGAGNQPGTVSYSLENGISPDVLQGVEVLIHCAYDFRPVAQADIWRVNVEGTSRLFDAARRAGVERIVCVSTISAYGGCRSLYGKAKLAIEDEALKAGGIVVRPGLVYGREAGGMLGSLNRIMASAKVVPLIGNGSWMMYLAFEDDLCDLICRLCDMNGNQKPRIITAASSRGKSFRGLLSELARAHGNNLVFIPVPWRVVWLGLRLMETLGILVGFRSDSVLGLVYPDPQPSFRELQEFGMTFRDFSPGLLK